MAEGKARLILSVVLAIGLLAACQSAPSAPAPPPPSYGALAPIRLDIGRIEIVDVHASAQLPTNVEDRVREPPASAAERWARERLSAVGPSGMARFSILEAAIAAAPLATSGGLSGVFTVEQAIRYDGRLVVSLIVEDPARLRHGQVSASLTASRTVAENATEADRQAAWAALTNSLIDGMNRELERSIPERLGPLVKP